MAEGIKIFCKLGRAEIRENVNNTIQINKLIEYMMLIIIITNLKELEKKKLVEVATTCAFMKILFSLHI